MKWKQYSIMFYWNCYTDVGLPKRYQTEILYKLISWGSISYEYIMRGVTSIYKLSWEIYKKGGGWLVTMILTNNGDDLLQRQIRYNGKLIGNERGRCNVGWLYKLPQTLEIQFLLKYRLYVPQQ
jgi:hypothetical protein